MFCPKCGSRTESAACDTCGFEAPHGMYDNLIAESAKKPMNKEIKKAYILLIGFVFCIFTLFTVYAFIVYPQRQYGSAASYAAKGTNADLATAASIYLKLGNYKDAEEKWKETSYIRAMLLKDNKNPDLASWIFQSLGDYKDSIKMHRICTLLKYGGSPPVAARSLYAAAIRNGRIETTGYMGDESCGYNYKEMFFEENPYLADIYGQTKSWEKIKSIAASDYHIVGLKEDGTVVAAGSNSYNNCLLDTWEDITSIVANDNASFGVRSNGTVMYRGYEFDGWQELQNWRGIKMLSASNGHVLGLKTDGTVVAAGNNDNGKCDVSDWKNIILVVAGNGFSLGLREDGTVVSVGLTGAMLDETRQWSDIVSLSAEDVIVGIKMDGSVMTAGIDRNGHEWDVTYWQYMIGISAGKDYCIGLWRDGTTMVGGYIPYEDQLDKGLFDTSTIFGWKSIGW